MTVAVNIPEELCRQACEIADLQRLSVNEAISSALAEQLAAWERLKQQAARGNRESFLRVMDKVREVEPEEFDRI